MRVRFNTVCVIVLLAGVLGACRPDPQPAPTPTKTPTMGAGPNTQPPVAATPTLEATPVGPFGPASYPEGINPLTGLPPADPAALNRRPLAIKVSNDPLGRPQSGLSFADLVFEHYAEGERTRLTAVYYSQSAERVGSVRSGRLLDIEIVQMFDAIYSASGFSDGVRKRFNAQPWANRNFSGPFYGEPYLVRIPGDNVAFEHTLFAVPDQLWALAGQRGVNQMPDLTPGMAFYSVSPADGTPASKVVFDYSTSLFKVEWQYDPATGKYLRSIGGEPHVDLLTGEQLAVENVIAVGAWHIETDIPEDTFAGGHFSIEIQIWGDGPLTLFRDGQRYEGRWVRNDPVHTLAFTDLNGNLLYIKPGKSWFEMVPIGFDKLFVEP